ncbi:MAG: 2-oxoglutarate dehydrogenase, E2 component, dihydrolipoamide succinyltransferase, partial [Bacteroidetes bacterium]|nr:2-oxoglutarate dehydrogenase, E2 component, dihydrolipoamide succinyltransferase [Bacteroidota bacterium]
KVEVSMPKMGESITEGTVIEWIKKPGDTVEMDEALLEIGTDKVDTEVPSPAAGVLTEIRVEAGDTVDVGTVIAVIETEASEAVVAQKPAPAPAAAAPAAKAEPAAPAPATSAPAPAPSAAAGIDVLMPKMGESIMEGTVITWHKKPGDPIELDETLLEIATDKVDTEVPSPAAGIVSEILVPEGDTVEVGTRIAVISAVGSAASALAPAPKAPVAEAAPAALAPVPVSAPAHAPGSVAAHSGDGAPIPRVGPSGEFFSPLVRSIAEKEGVSLAELQSLSGTGRDSRVTKADLMAYIQRRGSAPLAPTAPSAPAPRPAAPQAPAAPVSFEPTRVVTEGGSRVEIIKMDRMRQIIAEHMTRSKATSAHVTSFAEIDVTNLVRFREANKDAFERREGIKLTYTPFFVFAAVEALKDHPILNSSVEGQEIHVKKDYHVGIAVAIGKTGLVAPVIRNAGQMNVIGLAHAANDLAVRARSKQLLPDQLQGGTFTVTNVGSLGSIMGTPIINQPQVGILATGAIKKRPVVIEDPNIGDSIAIRSMMYVSLSYDHRIVDGAMASSFLRRYTDVMESFGPHGELR